jgi:hypothetical protein
MSFIILTVYHGVFTRLSTQPEAFTRMTTGGDLARGRGIAAIVVRGDPLVWIAS